MSIALPYPVVSQEGNHLDVEAVQGNFDALANNASSPALFISVSTDSGGSIIAANGFSVLSASNLTITVPSAGNWLATLNVGFASGNTAASYVEAGPFWTGLTPAQVDCASAYVVTANTGYSLTRSRVINGLSAGDQIYAGFHVSAGTGTFARMTLTASALRGA